LTLQDYDIQKLEEQIFGEVEDDMISNTNLRITGRQQKNTEDQNRMLNEMNHWLSISYHYEFSIMLDHNLSEFLIEGSVFYLMKHFCRRK
jgi:hypothetical protein